MPKGKLISKFIALILLVALSQKIGFGIFYHNAQHAQKCSTEIPAPSASVISSGCSCIDDFLMPFAETSIETSASPKISYQVFVLPPLNYISHFHQRYNSLRAPPVHLA